MTDDDPIDPQEGDPGSTGAGPAESGGSAARGRFSRQPRIELADEAGEDRYRRRVGIVLALLAIIGAWIAVLATDAATAESTTARESTRLAVEAQSADVLAKGLESSKRQIVAEVEAIGSKPIFADPVEVAGNLGIEVDPTRASQRVAAAEDAVSSAIATDGPGVTALSETAAELGLEQKATVEARIAWNAKASQYETVLTTLAIAVFLVGFTLVIGRRLRPPVAIPGVALAVFCIGWAGVIYSHEIPSVDPVAIEATAKGQVALQEDRAQDAIGHFTVALDAEPDYLPALRGRALATLVQTNPDVLDTMAVTDTSQATLQPAVLDMAHAMANGGDEDAQVLAVASLARTLSGEWEQARTTLDEAIELNPVGVELYLWRAAVAVALGDTDDAESRLREASERFADLDADRRRELVAQFLTVLEIVAVTEPERAADAEAIARQVIATATENAVGRPLEPGGSPDAGFEVLQADFADDSTSLRFGWEGIDEGAAVSVIGYERPAPDAGWVQPGELFYAGALPADGAGVTIDTPRSCAPVEYRFDLYVEGEFVESLTAPGVAPTC